MGKTHTAFCDEMRDHQFGCICGAWDGRKPSNEPFFEWLEREEKPRPVETRTVPATTLAALEAVARAAERQVAYWDDDSLGDEEAFDAEHDLRTALARLAEVRRA